MRPGQAYGPARGAPGARVASLIPKSRWQQVSGGERRDWELMQQPPVRSPAAAARMAAFYLPATQIADTFLPAGSHHLGFGLVDGRIVKTLTGTDRRGERRPPEARRPSRSQLAARMLGLDPVDCIAIEHSAAGVASARGGQMLSSRRCSVPGHPGPRRHADNTVADGPASVSVRPAHRPGPGYLNTYGEGT